MQIIGPKTKLKHIKRIEGDKTAAGIEITWGDPIRFEGIMTLLVGKEALIYQQMKVDAKYKIWTNYLNIAEEDRIIRGSITYDVKLVDPKFLMDKIAVVLLNVKKK